MVDNWIKVEDKLPDSKKEIICGVVCRLGKNGELIRTLSGYTNKDGFAIAGPPYPESAAWIVTHYFIYPPLPK